MDLDSWRIRAAEQQQAFYTLFSDREWDKLDKKHYEFTDNLKLKVSFAIFARPFADCQSTEKQRINSVVKEILRLSDTESIYIGYTYVITCISFSEGIIPLIRIKGKEGKIYFIESQFTFVYNNWDDFVKNHKLDYGNICYPKNGIYKRRNEGRVLLEYCMSGSRMNTHLGIAIKPMDTYLYFPFAKCSIYETQISVQWSMTFVTLKKSATAILKSNPDFLDYLAIWLEIVASGFGKILKNNDDLISLSIEADQMKECVEWFKQFYDTPCSVNGHFAIVMLMKMVALRSVNKLTPQLLRYFSELLKFLFNVSFTRINLVENIIKVISDDDLFRLNNVFNVTFNCPYEEIKELKSFDDGKDIPLLISLLAKPKEETPLVKLSKNMLILFTNIIQLEPNLNPKDICLHISEVTVALANEFHQQYHDDTKRLTKLLLEKSSALMNINSYQMISIKRLQHGLLRRILLCAEHVSDKLAPDNEKSKNIFEREFLFYAFQFVQEIQAHMIEDDDAFLFLVGKFVSKCQAFLIHCESENVASFESEVSFFNFLSLFNDGLVVSKLKSDYETLKKMSKTKSFPMAITNFNGMRLYGKTITLDEVEILRPSAFNEFCEHMACDYLGVNEIPKEWRHQGEKVLLYFDNSNKKFVLNLVICPTEVQDVITARYESQDMITVQITFKLPF